ncbi:MAG: deoxyribose-phosphate aldolase [Muribaculaceae bacterium]|nr:deoxyribose-phosphate aldolase [Muribaculaceae bacterium]
MENINKYQQAIAASKVIEDDEQVSKEVAELLSKHLDENRKKEVYEFMLNCIDLTTLSSTDTQTSVTAFTEKVNAFDNNYPQLKNVAAICVYANFASVVSSNLDVTGVNVAVCSANFPSSQARLEVKTTETALAVADGADEVDIVLNLGLFFDDNFEDLTDEISEIKHSAGEARLKVILETGALKTAKNIKKASILSMYSGADFIKTSTGKMYDGATVEAAYVMCNCIKEYYEQYGTMIGFKASGGVSTTEDALKYYTIVKEVLGEKWLTNEYFRLGASRLANVLFMDITGETEKQF